MGDSSVRMVSEKIRVLLVKVELGPFSEKQVREYLSNGFLLPSDRAKYDGEESWISVDEVLAKLPPVEEIPPPVSELTTLDPVIGSRAENPFSCAPPEVLFKPVFEQVVPLVGSASETSYSWTSAEILFKPLFKPAVPLIGAGSDVSYSWKPPEVLCKPVFEHAAPLIGSIFEAPYSWKPPEVLYKPPFEQAAPLVELLPVTPYSWKPAEVLHKPLFALAAPLIGSDSEAPYLWKSPEILFKPVEASSSEPIRWLWMPPSTPSHGPETVQTLEGKVSTEKIVRDIPRSEPTSNKEEKAPAKSVRGVFQPAGRGEITPPTRLHMARTQARSRHKKSFLNRIRSRLKTRTGIYSFSGIVLATIFVTGYFWPVLQPLVSGYWIAMNLAMYGFFDEVVRALTTS